MKARIGCVLALLAAGCGGGTPAPQAAVNSRLVATGAFVSVFQDALASGWNNWSWASVNLANPAPVSAGTASLSVVYGPWTGINLASAGVSAAGLDFVDLKVNGGALAGQRILVRLGLGAGTYGPIVVLGGYCDGGAIPAGAFVRCQVPLADLGATSSSKITALVVQEGAGLTLPAMYFDEIGFSAAAASPAPPSVPAGLTAAARTSGVTLSWTPSNGATGYHVFRDALMFPVAAPPYVDTGVVAGMSYTYTVSALNAYGESAQSAPVSVVVPLPPPPPAGTFVFADPFLWQGDHAATLPSGGNTVWLDADAWDVRGDVEYNASAYLMTMVQQEKGFHVDIHKAASLSPSSAMMDNATYVVGGDGSRGLATFHLDFEDILSARLRNPMLITSDAVPGVVQFRAPRFVTTGHWWEVSITPASHLTPGEYTSVPAASAGLAGPFGAGIAVNYTGGVGNGHMPAEDSVNFVFQGFPDIPCSTGWFVHPEVVSTIAGTRTNVWVPVTAVTQLEPTTPAEIDVLYEYRLEFRPSGVDFYADWDMPGVLTLRGHYPLAIPWSAVHVQLLAVAYQADHHPQVPCFQGQVREIHWADLSVAPVKWASTSVAPRDGVTTDVALATGWQRHDLRDIQRYGPPTPDGLPLPNAAIYDRIGSMGYASFQVWASAVSPAPVQAVDLSVDLTAAQAAAAEARFLYDIRYTGTATLSVNGVVVGVLPGATTVPAAGVVDPAYATIWVRRAVQLDPSLLVAGTNRVHLALSGQVALDRLQLEFSHAQ